MQTKRRLGSDQEYPNAERMASDGQLSTTPFERMGHRGIIYRLAVMDECCNDCNGLRVCFESEKGGLPAKWKSLVGDQ